MNEHDRNFVGIVRSDEIEAGFLGEAIGQQHILDDQVVEVAHFPVEVIRCGPIGGERVLVAADGGGLDCPAFVELPGWHAFAVEFESGGDVVGKSVGQQIALALHADR